MLFYTMLSLLDDSDQDFVSNLFETYKKQIFEIAYAVVKNHHDAEDVLDEVMISIIENIEKFRSASRNGIASQIVIYSRNAAINCYNKNKRRSKRFTSITHLNEEGEQEDYNLPDLTADLDELIISRETVEIVQKYLQMLSTEQQDAIKLVYALGYSNVEAAKILHISPNAVGMRLFNAKKRLIDLAGGELSER